MGEREREREREREQTRATKLRLWLQRELQADWPMATFHIWIAGERHLARSGAKLAIFTFRSLPLAEVAFGLLRTWSFPVPLHIDPSGRRMAGCRWFDPAKANV